MVFFFEQTIFFFNRLSFVYRRRNLSPYANDDDDADALDCDDTARPLSRVPSTGV